MLLLKALTVSAEINNQSMSLSIAGIYEWTKVLHNTQWGKVCTGKTKILSPHDVDHDIESINTCCCVIA